jgi:hypothetical protein
VAASLTEWQDVYLDHENRTSTDGTVTALYNLFIIMEYGRRATSPSADLFVV